MDFQYPVPRLALAIGIAHRLRVVRRDAVERLPRRQTRVLTWPLVTVFGFIAQPDRHIFLKPNTTKEAARRLGFDWHYVSRPNWATYAEYLDLAAATRRALRDMRPRDLIDIQSFLWVQGSDEYR